MDRPPIAPVAWRPPPDRGLTGQFGVNNRLEVASRIRIPGSGPEDVVVDAAGNIVYGLADGRVMTSEPDGSRQELVAHTRGRPLGIELHPDGRVIVCDAYRGLLAVGDGEVQVLADGFEGEPFLFTNNATVADDGTIYFTVTSRRFPLAHYRDDLFGHSNTGRLFRRYSDGALEVLLSGLSFANGVALSSDQQAVFVAETGEYRIRKYRLSGPDAGSTAIFADNLPGIPDNLTLGPTGTLWAAMFTPRNRLLDVLLPRPRLRGWVAKLPESLQPKPVRHGFVIGFDETTANVTFNLQDPSGLYAPITTAREHDGRLWLGSLTEPAIAAIHL